jgi:hypothetical protein
MSGFEKVMYLSMAGNGSSEYLEGDTNFISQKDASAIAQCHVHV